MTLIEEKGGGIEPHTPIKGPVKSVLWERLDTDLKKPAKTTILTRYDSQGREIERIETLSPGVERKTVTIHEGELISRSMTLTYKDGKAIGDAHWIKWSYDEAGHLTEFRRGQGSVLQNHELNFEYDVQGRVIRKEYRQGAKDEPFSFTVYKYSDRPLSVQRMVYTAAGQRIYVEEKKLDAAGHVLDLVVTEDEKPWYHVAFKYDEKGRVIEQTTDPYVVGAGDDYSPLPGRVVTRYDDAKLLREQIVYGPTKTLVVRSIAQLDQDGMIASIRFFEDSGKFVSRPGSASVETTYDDHGNWTAKREWFQLNDDSPRVLRASFRQTITYR